MVTIDVLHLFPLLNQELISFLKELSPEDWQKQTVARQWKVKDVAAHLLDGNFRRIALHRDGWMAQPGRPIESYKDLVDYLNDLNADWVKATKRLSPQLLVDLLDSTNEEVYRLFSRLDPFAESVFPVSWAGENVSYNWFDIAREYTERWLHQQQIRDALNDRGIMTKQFYYPFLDIFMHAWPVTMKEEGDESTVLRAVIKGEGGGEWILKRAKGEGYQVDGWRHYKSGGGSGERYAAETVIDGDVAWKLFSKSVRKEDISGSYQVTGNKVLGEKILDMVSVMA